ncbi:hypothetical protein E7T09_05150 [Deinococcus sp. KSM4-11]|uniref:hypothetical protein n=1 Tax=Deinococcus sp. KSM4-11 TaxID=2568654 RepID=UPI0010A39C6B|nr:hypothetical protein [Deinococcus sp. KSM4-11]THF88583.1 hypothetical protein E7T09_05150 [Deinococcus sp. KSM4-11]
MSILRRLLTTLVPLALVATSGAGATDVKLGLNSSVGLGCPIVAGRFGLQVDRIGAYAQVGYCSSNVQGQGGSVSFGGGLSVDLFTTSNVTTYALVGGDVQGGNTVLHGDLGLRYGIALVPVEAYLEGGVQRTSTALGPVIGPRLAVGITYRMNVGDAQGSIPAPLTLDDGTPTTTYSGSAPAECKLTQEQDIGAARGAATAAANDGLSAAANSVRAAYSDVSYSIQITGVAIDGNSARVGGRVKVSATQRSSGQRVSGTYGGTISLVRDGCGWKATGYTRS